jgi:capsular exopolysaccharide synthesis family protein
MESGETRNLSDYLGVLRRRWKLIAVIVVLAGGISFAISQIRTPHYQASTDLQFQDPGQQANGLLGAGSADYFPQNQAGAGAARLKRDDVLVDASRALGGSPTPSELKSDTSTAVSTANNLVTVTVKADTAEAAAREANQLAASVKKLTTEDAKNFYEQRAKTFPDDLVNAQLKARLRALARVANPVTIVKPAQVPGSPSSPKPLRDTLIAVFLGLMLGIAAGFIWESLDKRATDADQVQKRVGLPLVGFVRKDTLGSVGMSTNGSGVVAEADLEPFRILRKNVDFMSKDRELNVVAVTSPLSEEGKSTVASWYACANALVGKRTVLVECDFRRPVSAKRFGFDPRPGLSDYLAGEAEPKEVLRAVDIQARGNVKLPVIPAGGTVLQATEMLASDRYKAFLAQLREAYDLVVIDCPPLLPVGDTLELLPYVDGVLLCVRLRQTPLNQAAAAERAIDQVPDLRKGLVVTGLTRSNADDYYGYYSAQDSARSLEGAET